MIHVQQVPAADAIHADMWTCENYTTACVRKGIKDPLNPTKTVSLNPRNLRSCKGDNSSDILTSLLVIMGAIAFCATRPKSKISCRPKSVSDLILIL